MSKTFETLVEETTEINEGLVRKGATIFYAAQVKQDGLRVEHVISKSKQSFADGKRQKDIPKKLDDMMDGMGAIGDAIIYHRRMIGNLTGLALSAALFVERSDKQMIKLIKGKR